MLSAFKKKFTKSPSDSSHNNHQSSNSKSVLPSVIDPVLRKKFARGVQYNLKILIKGDRNVGKTCLFNRLQGKPFTDEYLPTDEIQAASIQWNYKATDDIVKVDVWDVVDKSRTKRKIVDGLKLKNHIHEFEDANLDAQFIDVYKDAHGVLLMFDVTKAWTWEYVQREIQKIPTRLPVLVLANRLDMSHHRQITRDQASLFVENIERPIECPGVRYAEASMRNSFGLKLIYLFFNVPFLILQKETLQRQLETNAREVDLSLKELDLFAESDENSYEKFSEYLNSRRRKAAENVAPKPTIDVAMKARAEVENNTIRDENAPAPEASTAVDDVKRQAISVKQPANDELREENFDKYMGDETEETHQICNSSKIITINHNGSESDEENPFNSMVVRKEEDLNSVDDAALDECCCDNEDSNMHLSGTNDYMPAHAKRSIDEQNPSNGEISIVGDCRTRPAKLSTPIDPIMPDLLSGTLDQWLDSLGTSETPNDPGPSFRPKHKNEESDDDEIGAPNPLVASKPIDSSDSELEEKIGNNASSKINRPTNFPVGHSSPPENGSQRRNADKSTKAKNAVKGKKMKKPKSCKINKAEFFGQSSLASLKPEASYEEL